jgi:hypothetical protein
MFLQKKPIKNREPEGNSKQIASRALMSKDGFQKLTQRFCFIMACLIMIGSLSAAAAQSAPQNIRASIWPGNVAEGPAEARAAQQPTPKPKLIPPKESWISWVFNAPERMVERLLKSAGDGRRGVVFGEKIGENPESIGVWVAELSKFGNKIDSGSVKLVSRGAMMPSWSNDGSKLVCSVWQGGRWRLRSYRRTDKGFEKEWDWESSQGTGDFAPVWAGDDSAIAFVRQQSDKRTDMWLLKLDPNGKPVNDKRVTTLGSVSQVVGLDSATGVLLVTGEILYNRATVDLLWRIDDFSPSLSSYSDPVALCVRFPQMRGRSLKRDSVILAVTLPGESSNRVRTKLVEINKDGEQSPLFDAHQWSDNSPSVRADGKLLAFDSTRP